MLRGTIISLFFASLAHGTTTVVFQPDSSCGTDASIFSLWPTTNSGTHSDFIACAWTNQGNPSMSRALISFDLGTIPPNATIVNASFELFHYSSPYNTGHSNLSGPAACWLQRITQPWSETAVTWSNQPTTIITNQVNVPAPSLMNEDYFINVTTLVQDMIDNPATSFGFMLRLQNESYYRSLLFASSDMSNPALHPKLTVTYLVNQLPAAGCWDTAYVNSGSTSFAPAGPDPVVWMPNVFSPNGDGINDNFFADSVDYRVDEFLIYDRWGILVYSSRPGQPWDGRTTSGTPCTTGTYYYVFRCSNSGAIISKTGFVTLIR